MKPAANTGLQGEARLRVLVVYYSNSGDVEEAVRELAGPLDRDGAELTWLKLKPEPMFGFPWKLSGLFQTAPETVGEFNLDLVAPTPPLSGRFDLVLLGWQVWWLRPSAVIASFLRSRHSSSLEGVRVMPIGCSRQMWQSAFQHLAPMIGEAGGTGSDFAMVRYEGSGLTLVTTPLKLLTGRRNWSSGLPVARLRRDEIARLRECGERLWELRHAWGDPLQPDLLGSLAPRSADSHYRAPEKIGSGYMSLWRPFFRVTSRRGGLARTVAVSIWALGFAIGLITVVPGWVMLRSMFGWLSPRKAPT